MTVTTRTGLPAGPAVLILVRHGESTGNAAGLLLGRIDAPLTERGLAQARSLAGRGGRCHPADLEPAGPGPGHGRGAGHRPAGRDRRAVDRGRLRRVRRPAARRRCPPRSGHGGGPIPDFRPPGGERLAEAGARVRSACEELFADRRRGRAGDGSVVVVSHVSPIKAATCWALGLGDEGAWRLYLATASVTRITWGPGGPVLAGFNQTPWSSPD